MYLIMPNFNITNIYNPMLLIQIKVANLCCTTELLQFQKNKLSLYCSLSKMTILQHSHKLLKKYVKFFLGNMFKEVKMLLL